MARTSSARKERLQKLFSPDGKLTQDLIDGFARSIQKNNSLFQLLLGMAKMITALKGDNSFFSFYKYRLFSFVNLQKREVRQWVGRDVGFAPPSRGVHVFLELHPSFKKNITIKRILLSIGNWKKEYHHVMESEGISLQKQQQQNGSNDSGHLDFSCHLSSSSKSRAFN